jgi:hypothetical protein
LIASIARWRSFFQAKLILTIEDPKNA